MTILELANQIDRLAEAKIVMEDAYDKHWVYQHPERRGQMIVPGDEAQFRSVFSQLGISRPPDTTTTS